VTVSLDLRIQPGAPRSGFTGWYGDVPKLAVAAPPVDGAANDAAVDTLAELFGLRPRHVRLVGGASSRNKRFEITGITAEELRERLNELNPPPV
jgi:uncharacterized protein (TIGR00251 family)